MQIRRLISQSEKNKRQNYSLKIDNKKYRHKHRNSYSLNYGNKPRHRLHRDDYEDFEMEDCDQNGIVGYCNSKHCNN